MSTQQLKSGDRVRFIGTPKSGYVPLHGTISGFSEHQGKPMALVKSDDDRQWCLPLAELCWMPTMDRASTIHRRLARHRIGENFARAAETAFDIMEQHFGLCPKKTRTIRFAVTGISVVSKPRNHRIEMISVRMPQDKLLKLNLHPVDTAGRPEPLDGLPTVKVVSGNVTVLVQDKDTIIITPNGPGESVVEVDADAAEGEEVEIITETINITVTHPNAVNLGVTTELIDAPPAP